MSMYIQKPDEFAMQYCPYCFHFVSPLAHLCPKRPPVAKKTDLPIKGNPDGQPGTRKA
jgi:hypothetical protein